jgi:hypothetical protein
MSIIAAFFEARAPGIKGLWEGGSLLPLSPGETIPPEFWP